LKTSNGGYGLGITEQQQTSNSMNQLRIYPNPATEKTTIEPSGSGTTINGTISVYGMNGQELIHQKVYGLKVEVDVSSLSTSIYGIKLIRNEKIEYGKFVKN
jgi:hypothetical protein